MGKCSCVVEDFLQDECQGITAAGELEMVIKPQCRQFVRLVLCSCLSVTASISFAVPTGENKTCARHGHLL